MSWLLSVFIFLFGPVKTETCVSTIFGYPGDKWAGGDALYLKRPVNSTDVGIAHRFLPLGSYVIVHNRRTGKEVLAQVIDRGPYGAMYKGKWRIKRNRKEPGVWRGCADLTPKAAKLVGHDGWDKVTLYSQKR